MARTSEPQLTIFFYNSHVAWRGSNPEVDSGENAKRSFVPDAGGVQAIRGVGASKQGRVRITRHASGGQHHLWACVRFSTMLLAHRGIPNVRHEQKYVHWGRLPRGSQGHNAYQANAYQANAKEVPTASSAEVQKDSFELPF